MKLCPRCRLRKPDACFTPHISDRGKCLNCRDSRPKLHPRNKKVKMNVFQAEEIAISAADAKLVASAQAEMAKFRHRGSPRIERPYAFIGGDPKKGMVSRRAFQKV